MVLDDLARQHEPDARAMRLGREERHPEIVRACETGAVVLDLDQDRAAIEAPATRTPPASPAASTALRIRLMNTCSI